MASGPGQMAGHGRTRTMRVATTTENAWGGLTLPAAVKEMLISPSAPVVLPESDEETERRERMRSKVIEEIVETERKYLEDITILLECYVVPLRESGLMNDVHYADAMILFSTVEDIRHGNNELLALLEQQTKEQMLIGEVFQQMADRICQFNGVFCNHQKKAMDGIDQLSKSLPAFRAQLDHCRKLTAFRIGNQSGLGILDLLVKPFQRLLKYPLLIEQLIKYTDPSHPDFVNLDGALVILQQKVDVINNQKADSDNLKRLLECNSLIDGLPKGFRMVTTRRRFIHEGDVGKISGANDQERHLFLFNDCLIYTKRKGPRFIYRGMIPHYRMRLEPLTEEERYSWKVHRSDLDKDYIFYVPSDGERKIWIRMFQEVIENSSKKTRTALDRDLVRVYYHKTFKTFAITDTQTVGELYSHAIKKITLGALAEDCLIGGRMLTVINGVRENMDLKVPIRDVLKKTGQKMNDLNCHFLIVSESVKLPAGINNLDRIIGRSPLSNKNAVLIPSDTGVGPTWSSPVGSPDSKSPPTLARSPPSYAPPRPPTERMSVARASSSNKVMNNNTMSPGNPNRKFTVRSKSTEDLFAGRNMEEETELDTMGEYNMSPKSDSEDYMDPSTL